VSWLVGVLVAIATVSAAVPAAAQTYLGPTVLLVNPKSNIKTLVDFIAWGRQSPAPLTYASEGAGSAGQMFGEAFTQKLGIKAVHVPYRGPPLALADLIAGFVNFGTLPVYAAAGPMRAGLLTPVALVARERLSAFPEVPTCAKSGYPEFVGASPTFAGAAQYVRPQPRGN
jgi:tripartite-type tricarboxylate transporter receptor subunit TctC